MTPDEARARLEEVRAAMHERFPAHPDRLAQLDSSLATASMVIEHMPDEEARHADLVSRIRTTPLGLAADDPRNLHARHGHQVGQGVALLEEA